MIPFCSNRAEPKLCMSEAMYHKTLIILLRMNASLNPVWCSLFRSPVKIHLQCLFSVTSHCVLWANYVNDACINLPIAKKNSTTCSIFLGNKYPCTFVVGHWNKAVMRHFTVIWLFVFNESISDTAAMFKKWTRSKQKCEPMMEGCKVSLWCRCFTCIELFVLWHRLSPSTSVARCSKNKHAAPLAPSTSGTSRSSTLLCALVPPRPPIQIKAATYCFIRQRHSASWITVGACTRTGSPSVVQIAEATAMQLLVMKEPEREPCM